MDNVNKDKIIDKTIIDKIMSIGGVEACAVSSLDGEVLLFSASADDLLNGSPISDVDIKRVSLEISRLFASYSISSIDISYLYLNFEFHNIIVHGFGSGFIFIASSKNSNVNLLKMETSYLENEFIKIVNQSFGNISSKSSLFQGSVEKQQPFGQVSESENITVMETNGQNFPIFGEISAGEQQTVSPHEPSKPQSVPLNIVLAIKDLLSRSLGPISSLIFKSKLELIEQKEDNIGISQVDIFIKLLAEEIEDKNDRRIFINNARELTKNL